MERIASPQVLQQAFAWLCRQRKDYPDGNDVWDLHRRWNQIQPQLRADLLSGAYRLGAPERIRREDSVIELWSSLDALVLKAAAIVLSEFLRPRFSGRCFHVAGNGGSKAAVRAVMKHLRGNTFVFRTDVKSYYASIDPDILLRTLEAHIKDRRVTGLLWEYMYRTVYDGGWYKGIRCGICRGCALSPVMGTLYLKILDDRMARTGSFYVRFMDDVVLLTLTRWKLRAAIKRLNQTLAELKLERHPDKTFVGRISRGFDFLGYRITPTGLTAAAQTVERFAERVARLYEQGADGVRIGQYARRWCRWVKAGVRSVQPPYRQMSGRSLSLATESVPSD